MVSEAEAKFTHDITKIIQAIEVLVAIIVIGIVISKIYSDTATQVTIVLLILGLIVFFA